AGVLPCLALPCLALALAALRRAGEALLGGAQGLLSLAIMTRILDSQATCRDKKHLQADINACLTPRQGHWVRGAFHARETDIPVIGFVADRHGLDRARTGAGPAHGTAAQLG